MTVELVIGVVRYQFGSQLVAVLGQALQTVSGIAEPVACITEGESATDDYGATSGAC